MLAKIWKFLRLPTKLQLFIIRLFHDEFLLGVTGIFFDGDNRVMLVRHSYRGDWSLPGGYVKGREHPKEALEREVMEETGLTVSADQYLKTRADSTDARLDMTYFGKYIGGDFKKSNEVKEVKLFPFDKLPRLPKDQLVFIDRARNIRGS